MSSSSGMASYTIAFIRTNRMSSDLPHIYKSSYPIFLVNLRSGISRQMRGSCRRTNYRRHMRYQASIAASVAENDWIILAPRVGRRRDEFKGKKKRRDGEVVECGVAILYAIYINDTIHMKDRNDQRRRLISSSDFFGKSFAMTDDDSRFLYTTRPHDYCPFAPLKPKLEKPRVS